VPAPAKANPALNAMVENVRRNGAVITAEVPSTIVLAILFVLSNQMSREPEGILRNRSAEASWH
jgi:hypothetical protein